MVPAVMLALLQLALASRALPVDPQEPQILIHEARIHMELSHNRRSHREEIYRDARDRVQKERAKLPDSAYSTPTTDLGDFRRIWDFYTPDYNCPLLKERVGRLGDGGKWVCGLGALLEDRPCTVYSVGSNGETTFEVDILNRTSCEVHTFDPTLSNETQSVMAAAVPEMRFHPIGIGRGEKATLESLSDKDLHSLEQVMEKLGHQWVDVLKMDIEGHEWDVFGDLYAKPGSRLPTTQLLVEFHWPGNSDRVWQVLDALLADKFRVFSVEPNYYCDDGACAKNLLEFAFIKVSDDGYVCSPHGHVHGTTGSSALALPHGC